MPKPSDDPGRGVWRPCGDLTSHLLDTLPALSFNQDQVAAPEFPIDLRGLPATSINPQQRALAFRALQVEGLFAARHQLLQTGVQLPIPSIQALRHNLIVLCGNDPAQLPSASLFASAEVAFRYPFALHTCR
jgi:hypothetical protein